MFLCRNLSKGFKGSLSSSRTEPASNRSKVFIKMGKKQLNIPNLRSGSEFKAHVTCSVFSDDGEEILGSYNDEDIYLFNTSDPEGSSHKNQYQGHRNSATVKGN